MSTLPTQPRLIASRRVDFHLRGSALSRWKYRQVDCFICASEAIRTMLVGDGIAKRRTVTVHEGIDLARVEAAPPAELHKELWLPHDAPHRRQRRGARAAQGSEVPDRRGARLLRDEPDTRFIIAGEGELQAALGQPDQAAPPGEARHPRRVPARHAVAAQGVRRLRDELGHRGSGHVAARRDGLRAGRWSRPASAGFPEVVVDGETGLLVPPRDPGGAGRRNRAADLGPRRCARKWARPAWRACRRRSARSTWCGTR